MRPILLYVLFIVMVFSAAVYVNLPPRFDCGDYNCYEEYYAGLTKTSGVQKAFADLKSRYDDDAMVKSQCHQFTHVIGRTASLKVADPAQAFVHGDSFCWSGYYHGVMEGILSKIGFDNLPARINSVCVNIRGREAYSFDYYNCVHGLGHGVMFITSHELFDSLRTCRLLSGQWEQWSCAGGVFMENIIADHKTHKTKYLKPEDPLFPCNAVADDLKQTCFLMQTSYMLKVSGNDFSRVFELCSAVDDKFVDTCYQSLGRDASGQTVSDVQQTRERCLLGRDARQQLNCFVGAAKDFISYHHSDVQARELCMSVPVEFRQVCSTTVDDYYRTFK